MVRHGGSFRGAGGPRFCTRESDCEFAGIAGGAEADSGGATGAVLRASAEFTEKTPAEASGAASHRAPQQWPGPSLLLRGRISRPVSRLHDGRGGRFGGACRLRLHEDALGTCACGHHPFKMCGSGAGSA